MASRFFSPTLFSFAHHGLRTPLFAAGLGFSSALVLSPLLQYQRGRPLLLDSSPAAFGSRDAYFNSYAREAQVPVVKKDGQFNRRAVRQLSLGSITGVAGLVAGLAVSWFSKPLTILLGLAMVGVSTLEHYAGFRIVPYKMIQRYVTSVDVRSALQDNVALKISFGLMFALSGFAEF